MTTNEGSNVFAILTPEDNANVLTPCKTYESRQLKFDK